MSSRAERPAWMPGWTPCTRDGSNAARRSSKEFLAPTQTAKARRFRHALKRMSSRAERPAWMPGWTPCTRDGSNAKRQPAVVRQQFRGTNHCREPRTDRAHRPAEPATGRTWLCGGQAHQRAALLQHYQPAFARAAGVALRRERERHEASAAALTLLSECSAELEPWSGMAGQQVGWQ